MADDVALTPANGAGAAAIVAAAGGCLAVAAFALAGDAAPGIAAFFTFWTPTGPLSGVTSSAILVWLAAWLVLSRAWRRRDLDMRRVTIATAALLGGAILLTFPPFADLLLGK